MKKSLEEKLIFLSILLIGSDIFSIKIGGSTIRIVQGILIIIVGIMIYKKKFEMTCLVPFIIFIISNLISLLVSVDIKGSSLYIMWTIYSYICVFCLFYSWARRKTNLEVYKIWRMTYYIQGVMVILQFFLVGLGFNILSYQRYKGIPRPALWFYEPSYIATYFIVFFGISLYMYLNTKEKRYRKDTIFATIFLCFITSTSGFIGMGIAIFVCIIASKKSILKKIIDIISCSIVAGIIVGIVSIIYPKIIEIFIGRIFTQGITASAGNRVVNWGKAYKVYTTHKLFGVGPNAYMTYTGAKVPATNVTLEILACLGIIGLITFLIFIGSILLKSRTKILENNSEYWLSKAIVVGFIIFIIVLQFNQNYLRLYMWMQMGFIAGVVKKKEIKENRRSL